MRIVSVFLLWGLLSSLVSAADFDREQIEARIKPLGAVNVKGAGAPGVVKVTKAVLATAKKHSLGQAIYEQYCVVCHRDGVAGAPKYRDAADWGPRLAKQPISSLRDIAIKGLNAMPANGTCSTCSPLEIQEAIEYMVPQS